ncbi:TraI/MobA(P) family conjugative relaxase [Thalassospira australica]|uniref:TraI/MobA(P) family conjugative relaxase n=1 Tax=Thalassospira australica TaxID=1528106 RepID=UPI00384AAB96
MIAKKIPKRPDIPDNYKELAEYIAAAKEPGEKLDKFWIENCGAGETLDDLELALREVYAVRLMKPEVTDKSYHMMVSFRPGEKERLSEQDLKDIASAYAEGLGFAEHQYVAGTHINTDNFHMHIAFNKIHPRTLQVVNPFRDFKLLERVSRKLEKQYGLFIDRGMAQREKQGPKLSPSARDFEAQTWQESFQNHVLQHREDLLDKINGAEAWQDLHRFLAEHDIELKKRGNGFVLVGPDGQGMKASALDRGMSKSALEKKLGDFVPPVIETDNKPTLPTHPKRRYKRRPTMRHPRMSPLWRRYLNIQQPLHRRSTLLSRTISNWKLFLLSEAYRDPLAMVFLIAQQEFIHLIFGDDRPTPVSKLAAPALAAWREAGKWADAKSLNWLADTRSTGRGCRLDDVGNLLVPFKDENGFMQAVRIYAPGQNMMSIGNIKARGLTHIIDTRKQINSGPVIFTADYADAVKIHDATRRPVVIVADPRELQLVIRRYRKSSPLIKPVVAGKTDAKLPSIGYVRMPNQDDQTEIRRAFARATEDEAFLVWDACPEWATPGNSSWLKSAGIRGYGVKLTPDGEVAVPLKDRSGRLENVILIDQKGNQRAVFDPIDNIALSHVIDPAWRDEKDTVIVALDYADAAAIHRATRCPVVVPETPDDWQTALEQTRLRYSEANIVLALDKEERPGERAAADKFAALIVRPTRADTFKEYALYEPSRSAARLMDMGRDHYNFDPDKSESEFVKLQDQDGTERYVWGVDIAGAVNSSGAKPGDWITLDIAEKKKVEVVEKYRDDQGNLQNRTVTTHRNVWKAEVRPDPETVPSMTALRNEMAVPVGDDGWLAWQQASRPDKRVVSARNDMGSYKAWAGFRVDDTGNVLIPLRDCGNRLSAVYRINEKGSVETLGGTGDDKGLHHVIGGRISKDPDDPILMADDLISAIELNRLTKKPVVWAVKSENLEAVGKTLRRFNPDRKIVIAAMDAHMAVENKPLDHAKKAAIAIDADLLSPPLSDQDKKRNYMSFGDMLKSGQIDGVKTSLKKVGIDGDDKPLNRQKGRAQEIE